MIPPGVMALTRAVALTLVVLALSCAVEAQHAGSVWRIGFLSQYSVDYDKSVVAGLRKGLHDLGYVEGRSIVLEQRHADGRLDKLPELASDLVRLKVDLVVAHGVTGLHVRKASSTIPIVFVANPDPVGLGFVTNLARPGGNTTGLSDLHSELVAKRLELLKEMVPSASRVGVLMNADSPGQVRQLKDAQAAAPALKLSVVPVEIRGADDIEPAFTTMRRERLDALNVLGGAATIHLTRVAALAVKGRIPTMATTRRAAERGILMAYGADFPDLYRRAATYIDKILKGARPGDLAVEQPTKFELVINMKTATALGLTIPRSLRLRADHVIE